MTRTACLTCRLSREFEAHIGFKPPKARVVALCFDKIDIGEGRRDPRPRRRSQDAQASVERPSLSAWQGADGLRLVHAEGRDEERETPPAEPLMAETAVQAPGRGPFHTGASR